MIMNGNLGMMGRKVAIARFKVLSENMAERIEDNHKKKSLIEDSWNSSQYLNWRPPEEGKHE